MSGRRDFSHGHVSGLHFYPKGKSIPCRLPCQQCSAHLLFEPVLSKDASIVMRNIKQTKTSPTLSCQNTGQLPSVPVQMVHLLEAPPEVTHNYVFASYFQIWRPDLMTQQTPVKRLCWSHCQALKFWLYHWTPPHVPPVEYHGVEKHCSRAHGYLVLHAYNLYTRSSSIGAEKPKWPIHTLYCAQVQKGACSQFHVNG